MVVVGRPVTSSAAVPLIRSTSRSIDSKLHRSPILSRLHRISIGLVVSLHRQRSTIVWLSLIGFAALVIFGTIATLDMYRDRMIQRLNLLFGRKRPGQGHEVRAVLPITVRPLEDVTLFVGRRCREEHDLWWRHSLVICEECASDGQCSVMYPRDPACRRPLLDSSSISQITSQYSVHSAELIAYWQILPTPDQPGYHFHPHCSLEACWDLDKRCQNQTYNHDFVMTVHLIALPSSPPDIVVRLAKILDEVSDVELVPEPKDACLVVLFGATETKTSDIATIMSVIGNGQNILVWDVSILGINGLHFGKSAIASRHGLHAWMRLEYDIVLPQHEPKVSIDDTFQDTVLLSCAVSQFDTLPIWIAHQYWVERHDADNFIAVPPCRKLSTERINKIMSSTFTFIANDASFLYPTIAIGSIPVVMNSAILPFWPDIPWDQCVYQVDQSRVVDLPHLLSELPNADIQHRRQICLALSRQVFGDSKVERDIKSFAVAMSTMRNRILRAQQLRSVLEKSMAQ